MGYLIFKREKMPQRY